ncbi:SET domain-containing protein SmydA-8 [Drosophila eugracilis]|uniref:SET domain-containing protein SmydA-8 n=1 Tax=Drosophila eugracilis TaxID=29029 RepID=UPI0007E7110F|nr:SET domain-containing protein SmydA-8 [Drosophila eugracilis]
MGSSADCPVCGMAASQACSRCKMVRYCDQEHQKQHWPQHKRSCRPFREKQDAQLGRFLMATQDIAARQVVFIEEPLVVGPKWHLSDAEKEASIFLCVGCYTPCRLGKYQCRRCLWPICSSGCAHEALECSVLSLGSGSPARVDIRTLNDYFRGDALLVLKCLLLQRQCPAKWASLLEMQSHEEERMGTELHEEAEKRVVSYLQQRFLRRLKQTKPNLLHDCGPELLHRLCGIIETNFMVIELPSGVELSGLFRQACMMEHACQPNCDFQFDPKTQQITVRAGCDLRKGDHLRITYTNILWGTQLRQYHLRLTKHFSCRCSRCLDPTEYGTYISALACLGDVNQTCVGRHLPVDPLDENTQWKCDSCPMLVDGTYVAELQTHITEEVDGLMAGCPSANQVELLLARLSQMLHPNHFHTFNLKHTLIQLYGNEAGLELSGLSNVQLDRKLRLCDELYNVCRRLDPHSIKLAIYVTVILIEIAHTLEEQARRRSGEGKMLLELAQVRLKEAEVVMNKEQDSVACKKLKDKLQKEIFECEKQIMILPYNQKRDNGKK